MKINYILLVIILLLSGCYGEKKAEIINNNLENYSKKVSPGMISTYKHESSSTFSQDYKTIYFSIKSQKNNIYTIYKSIKINNKWTKPVIASFSGKYSDMNPFLSTDGNTIYFASQRPHGKNKHRRDYNIWYSKKINSVWREPEFISNDDGINTIFDELYVSVSKNKNLYFSRSGDIFKSEFINGKYKRAKRLEFNINTDSYYEFDPYISPNESFLIFSSTITGSGDLYISFNNNNNWGTAKKINENVNTENAPEYAPNMSPDLQYLFFSRIDSLDNGYSNIYKINFYKALENIEEN